MKPIEFPEQNVVYTRPEGMTDEECGSLPTFQGGGSIISCWQLDEWERQQVLESGVIWLHVITDRQPPVLLSVDYPFYDTEEVK